VNVRAEEERSREELLIKEFLGASSTFLPITFHGHSTSLLSFLSFLDSTVPFLQLFQMCWKSFKLARCVTVELPSTQLSLRLSIDSHQLVGNIHSKIGRII